MLMVNKEAENNNKDRDSHRHYSVYITLAIPFESSVQENVPCFKRDFAFVSIQHESKIENNL